MAEAAAEEADVVVADAPTAGGVAPVVVVALNLNEYLSLGSSRIRVFQT